MSTNAICAIATAKGSSALGIIRVSGTGLESMLEHLLQKLYDRKATLTDIKKDDILFDNCIVILYCAPKSYTEKT